MLNSPDKFLDLFAKWRCGFGSETLRALATRHDDTWDLRFAFVGYSAKRRAPTVPDLRIETENLIAIRQSKSFSSFDEIEPCIKLSESPMRIRIESEDFLLRHDNDNLASYHFHPINHPLVPGPLRIPALQITANNHSLPTLLDRRFYDLELANNQIPFDGIHDLVATFGFPQEVFDGMRAPSIEIAIEPPALLSESSTLSDGKLTLNVVKAPDLDPKDMLIGIRILTRTEIAERSSITGSELEWADDGDVHSGIYARHFEGAVAANIYLGQDGEALGRFVVRDQGKSFNRLLELHGLVDNHSLLTDRLEGAQGNELEGLVALVVGLSGMAVLSYGSISGFKDWPDILALSEMYDLYPIECTAGDVDSKGKLLNLFERTELIRGLNSEKGLGFRNIQPILVTNLARAQTEGSWGKLRNFGIALVCREELHQFVEGLENPMNAERFLETVTSLVPSEGSSSQHSFEL